MTPPEVWSDRDSGTEPDTPGWRIRVVPNKYPALERHGGSKSGPDGLYRVDPAFGVHEVIIESAAHDTGMSALSARQFAGVFRAYRARWRALATDTRWRYLLIYKNQGERAGATLAHVHSQLVALPAVPSDAADERNRARTRFELAGRCVYCAMIERERQDGERLVSESKRYIALCPFAPRFAYETWILPKNHAAHFAASSDEDLAALGKIMRGLLRKLDNLVANAPLNYMLHSAPLRETVDEFCHWHCKILPQLNRAAGFEWGTGMHINPVAPEEAAKLLRDAPG